MTPENCLPIKINFTQGTYKTKKTSQYIKLQNLKQKNFKIQEKYTVQHKSYQSCIETKQVFKN